MRFLFVLEQQNFVATYTRFLTALNRRGHSVRLAWPGSNLSMPEGLSPASVSVEIWPSGRSDEWAPLVGLVRRAGDYLRDREFTGLIDARRADLTMECRLASGGDGDGPTRARP
jgi:hypothetical protein